MGLAVVVLTYRRPAQLDRTLASLSRQTLRDWTALVCDDASEDGTAEVMEAWAQRDARFVPAPAPRNLGMPENLIRGLTLTEPDRDVMIVHDADTFAPNAFDRYVQALEQWPRAGVVFSQYAAHDADGANISRLAEHFPPYSRGMEFLQKQFHGRWTFGSPIHGSALVRRAALNDVGLPRREFGHLADVDWWMRICERWGIGFIDEPVVSLATRAASPQNWGTTYRVDRRLTRRMYLASRLRVTSGRPMLRVQEVARHIWFAIRHELYYSAAEARGRLRRG